MKHRTFAAILALTVAGGTSIEAYIARLNNNGIGQRWFLSSPSAQVPGNSVNRSTRAIRYYLQEDAFSEANRDSELDSVRNAFGQWAAVPNSSIKFEEVGLISGPVDVNTQNGTNVVYWAKNSTLVNGETADIRGLLGVAFISGFAELPMIAESDIVFNGVENDWFTDFSAKEDSRQFIEGVAIHEIGHLLGLAHSTIGGATMSFDSGGSGVGTVVGLSPDEIAFVDQAYGNGDHLATRGTVSGVISKNGQPVYGASIVLEDETGAIVTGGISRLQSAEGPDGHYIIQGIPAGNYHIRVHPLQPDTSNDWVVIPAIIPLVDGNLVDTDFVPTANMPITVTAAETLNLDIEVEEGQVPFAITGVRGPTKNGFFFSLLRSGVSLTQGDKDFVVGVYGSQLPTEGAALTITGPGITISPSETRPELFPGLVHIFAIASVADDAPPGLRSLVVRKGLDVAYAPGFLEILPKSIDFNFDGLDDAYQREHFSPFTRAESAPNADPDNDGFTNAEEAPLNSDPNDPNSIPSPQVAPFDVLSVSINESGSTVTFISVPGATYQLFSRQNLIDGSWIPVGAPVKAEGETTTVFDATATEEFEFYQVESLP